MIEHSRFMEVWRHLLKRFGKDFDADQAAAYLAYLNDAGLGTDEFVQAARALWASAKFFPAPLEFVTVRAAGEWPLVQRAMETWHGPEWEGTRIFREDLTERARQACARLGGIVGMRAAAERDPLRIKDRFEAEYGQAATAEALALPAAKAFPALPGAQASRRGGLQSVGQLTQGAVPGARA